MAVDSLESWPAGPLAFVDSRTVDSRTVLLYSGQGLTATQMSIRQTSLCCNILPPVLQHKQRQGSIHSTLKLLRSRQGALACFDSVHVTKP